MLLREGKADERALQQYSCDTSLAGSWTDRATERTADRADEGAARALPKEGIHELHCAAPGMGAIKNQEDLEGKRQNNNS
jgi:hypothetical protein